MLQQNQSNRIFNLSLNFKDPVQNMLFSLMKSPIEHFLAFPRLNRVYSDIISMEDDRSFPEKALERLHVAYDLAEADRKRITISHGPVLIVANHPFGGIEGIILASILRSVRSDVKFMANYLLKYIPEMRDFFISVNPFNTNASIKENIKPIRECIQWLKQGGMLVVFPAGEVSHFNIQKGAITDPDWSTSVARISKITSVPVLPVFFRGTNSAAFHMAGMVHPFLRTAMLPNELFNKKHKKIQVRVGELIPVEKIQEFDRKDDLTRYLRLRTYLLELRNNRCKKKIPGPLLPIIKTKIAKPIILTQSPARMAEEVSLLPSDQILIENGNLMVIHAKYHQILCLLTEICRLREKTFRAVGEGTGKALDTDQYDMTYVHLFIWNKETRAVVGAYRLGKTDELIHKQGLHGLYTSTLFHYKPGFLERMGPALELGRSFVRPEYQKSYTPLLLLWKGIAQFLVMHPQYKTLFGPVSITREYQPLSKQLMVDYLTTNRYQSDLAEFVQPKKPFRSKGLRKWDIDGIVRMLKEDSDDCSDLISYIEDDRKGIPILLKQYLKLGGRIIGFNVDPAFGHVLDGLITVDLMQTDSKIRERYFGKEGALKFTEYHEAINKKLLVPCA